MSRPTRLDGFDYIGPHRYFLTFCTRYRTPVFLDGAIARLVLAHFRRTAIEHSFTYLAYCLMPDHAHALVEGLTSEADLELFVKSMKESSGRATCRAIRHRKPGTSRTRRPSIGVSVPGVRPVDGLSAAGQCVLNAGSSDFGVGERSVAERRAPGLLASLSARSTRPGLHVVGNRQSRTISNRKSPTNQKSKIKNQK